MRNLFTVFASLLFITATGAVTIDSVSKLNETENMTAAELIESGLSSGTKGAAGETLTINPVGSDHAGLSDIKELESQTPEEADKGSSVETSSYPSITTKSSSVFSLALIGMGAAVAFAGLVSLSFSRNIGGISRDEWVGELRSMSLASIRWNVSRNWRVKADATWFVVIGLGAALLGFLDWMFL